MRRSWHNLPATRQPGQAMVEFALVATILFLLLFGIIEVSRLVFIANEIANSAREGAHYAVLHPDAPASSITRQLQTGLLLVEPTGLSVDVDCPTCGGPNACLPSANPPCTTALYQPLTVTVTYTWTTALPLPIFAAGLPLSGQATMLRER